MNELDKRLENIENEIQKIAANQLPVFGNQSIAREDEIDLRELWNVFWLGKWWVIGITFLFAVAGVAYALSLPNIYRSEVLLAPADENSGGGLASMAGQLGGLASLAGVNLSGGGADKTTLAIEVLKSREFISYFIEKHDLLIPLMAAEGWNRIENELVLDIDLYNTETNTWIRDVSPPKTTTPSMQEAYEKFIEIYTVSQDKKTNFVSIRLEFFSPIVSKQWVDWLVEDINLALKSRDVAEAERSIEYLTERLGKTSIADMQAIFYELIEEQTKTVMFAEVRDEYVFKTIDKAIAPELKFKPKRALICVIGLILGGMFGVLSVLVCNFIKRQ